MNIFFAGNNTVSNLRVYPDHLEMGTVEHVQDLKIPWKLQPKNPKKIACQQKWLVVLTILKHISQWEGLSQILWKIKNVQNHQPEKYTKVIFFLRSSWLWITKG
jgi:hypothetical protein